MIHIDLGKTVGLTFDDWCDVLISVEDEATIADYRKDLLGEYYDLNCLEAQQVFWLNFLASWRGAIYDSCQFNLTHSCNNIESHNCQKEIPTELKQARGIGAWYNPKYIIITDKLHWGTRVPDGHKYLEAIPAYKRMRPFNENKKALKFFYQLLGYSEVALPTQTYITVIHKNWIHVSYQSETFVREWEWLISNKLDTIQTIVCLGNLVHKQFIDLLENFMINSDNLFIGKINDLLNKTHLLQNPTFYGGYHNWEWEQYRKQFSLFLEGKADAPR